MTHDVIVVGAGSAGCVVADRLSQKGLRILVLEAGPDSPSGEDEFAVRSPSFFEALESPGRTWIDLTARRTMAQPRRAYLRGRGIGGSSAVNAMVGLWGEVDDYDAWEREFGCVGWSWRDVEPYFRRVEIPLTRAETGNSSRLGTALVESGRTLGWHLHRGPFPLGGLEYDVGPAMLTRDVDGQRVSAADVYLDRARRRVNVDIRPNTLVDRLAIEDGVCRGVVLADGTEILSGSVIVSAGAIHTPAILLRSRIEREAIGRGIQDHPSVSFTFDLAEPCATGSLAVTSLARLTSGRRAADLQFLPIDHLGRGTDSFGVIDVALMYVTSRGRITLAQDDPSVDPAVDFDLLSTDDDIDRLSRGVRLFLGLVEDGQLARIARRVTIDDSGSDISTLDTSDSGLATWMASRAGAYVHAVGGCAMGDPHSDDSVVDPHGRLIGIEGAFVCDASIFPRVPRANTHLPVMMAAEKLSEDFASMLT